MKKTVLMLAVLMFAVPAMASITITAADMGSGIIQVSYARTGADDVNIPRAFALDVRMSPTNNTVLAPYDFNPNFYVAPGTFSYDANTGITNWGNPVVGPNTVGFTVEMGSLWATNDTNHPTQPPSSGVLFRFAVDKMCAITLTENAQRGGVVMESAAVTFPPGYVTLVNLTPPVCTVPNVVNLPEATAITAITDTGCIIGARTTACHPTIPPGYIISTNPPAGTPVPCGTPVDYVVSVPVAIPNVVGTPEANAVAALQAACLNVIKIYQWHATIPKGMDVNQVPAAGIIVPGGSNVTIGISRGPQPINCLANDANAAFLTLQIASFNSYVNNIWDPSCWCRFGNVGAPTTAGYQCHGDADGKNTGAPFSYRVYTGDLNLIISANWKKTLQRYPNGANPCADIDHKSTGAPFNYRVYTGDLNRVLANWKRKDLPAVGGLPRNCPLTDAANNAYVKP